MGICRCVRGLATGEDALDFADDGEFSLDLQRRWHAMFSGRVVKICMLMSCLSTAAVLGVQTLSAQNLPRPASDRALDQCEEVARAKELVASGFERVMDVYPQQSQSV